jgi:RNA polymerase sigma factor (sigma-70 family)
MPRHADISPESFDELLAWLNSDRELAASIYLNLRAGLIKIFSWNHCIDPEGMADETFDRVARQITRLRETFEGDPRLFFYGVANNLIKEYHKQVKSFIPIEEIDIAGSSPEDDEEDDSEMIEECLHACLQELSNDKRELVLAYYAKEKQAKIDHRTEMARQLGISVQTLRVRLCRIRAALEECIERRLEQAGHGK